MQFLFSSKYLLFTILWLWKVLTGWNQWLSVSLSTVCVFCINQTHSSAFIRPRLPSGERGILRHLDRSTLLAVESALELREHWVMQRTNKKVSTFVMLEQQENIRSYCSSIHWNIQFEAHWLSYHMFRVLTRTRSLVYVLHSKIESKLPVRVKKTRNKHVSRIQCNI